MASKDKEVCRIDIASKKPVESILRAKNHKL